MGAAADFADGLVALDDVVKFLSNRRHKLQG